MKILYTGGRSFYEVSFGRKPYCFTKDNNRILEISEQHIINHIFSLPNRAEFQVVVDEPTMVKKEDPIVVIKIEEPLKKKPGRPKK